MSAKFKLKIYVSAARDFELTLRFDEKQPLSAQLTSVAKILRQHVSECPSYTQVGRFVGKIEERRESEEDNLFPPSSLSSSTLSPIEVQLHKSEMMDDISAAANAQRIKLCDAMVVFISEADQMRSALEAQQAICAGVPVFLKFLNTCFYDMDSYAPLIQSAKIFMRQRAMIGARIPDSAFREISLLQHWDNEADYLEYLMHVPVCTWCCESVSRSRATPIADHFIFDHGEGEGEEEGEEKQVFDIKLSRYACTTCLEVLKRILAHHFASGNTVSSSKLVLAYLGI